MGLADLSSRGAVARAVLEFDRVGRSRFLDRYGFREARSYFLVVDGRRYDSKAIVAVAHRYQFPSEGALRAADFSGGERTVRRKLEELGFKVEVARERPPASRR